MKRIIYELLRLSQCSHNLQRGYFCSTPSLLPSSPGWHRHTQSHTHHTHTKQAHTLFSQKGWWLCVPWLGGKQLVWQTDGG